MQRVIELGWKIQTSIARVFCVSTHQKPASCNKFDDILQQICYQADIRCVRMASTASLRQVCCKLSTVRTCCKLTVKTCYPQACSVVSTSCNNSENDLAIATDFNRDFKIDKFVVGIKYQTCKLQQVCGVFGLFRTVYARIFVSHCCALGSKLFLSSPDDKQERRFL